MTTERAPHGESSSHGFTPPSVKDLQAALPKYEILSFIGQGPMGTVYKARQPQLDRLVAIKILPVDNASCPDFIENFKREAKAMGRLHHIRIVTVHDFGKAELPYTANDTTSSPRAAGASGCNVTLLYLVTEFVEGDVLARVINTRTFGQKEVLAIVTQVCDALHYAHDKGVFHRDIRPNNTMLDIEGQVKVSDFGLAKLMGVDQFQSQLTMANRNMGTMDYIAPEQLDPERPVDQRADVYSVGVMLYKLLCGKLPRGAFVMPSKENPDLDTRLDAIIVRAMQSDPEDRYPSITELWKDIERVRTTPTLLTGRVATKFHPVKIVTGKVAAKSSPKKLLTGKVPEKTTTRHTDTAASTGADATAPPPSPNRKPLFIALTAIAGALILGGIAWTLSKPATGEKKETTTSPYGYRTPKPDKSQAQTKSKSKPKPGFGPKSNGKPKANAKAGLRPKPSPDPSTAERDPMPEPEPEPEPDPTPDPKPRPEPNPKTTSVTGIPGLPPAMEPSPDPAPAPAPAPDSPGTAPTPDTTEAKTEADEKLDELLTKYREGYEATILADFTAKVTTLNADYLKALQRTEKKLATSGDLDKVLPVREEIIAVQGAGDLPVPPSATDANHPKRLREHRATYLESAAILTDEHDAKVAAILPPLDKNLEAIQVEFTRAEKIDDAVKIKTAREQFQTQGLPFTVQHTPPSPTDAAASASASAAPGSTAPTPPAASGPPVFPEDIPEDALKVTPTGDGDTLTLDEALQEAKKGQTIALAAGDYPPTTLFKTRYDSDRYHIETENLTLTGFLAQVPSLSVRAHDVTLRGLGFGSINIGSFGGGGGGDTRFPPIEVTGITLENCRFQLLYSINRCQFEAVNCIGAIQLRFENDAVFKHCTLIPHKHPGFKGHLISERVTCEFIECIVAGDEFAIVSHKDGPRDCTFRKCLLHAEKEILALARPPETTGGPDVYLPATRREADTQYGLDFSACLFDPPGFLNPEQGDYRLDPSSPGKAKYPGDQDLGATLSPTGWPVSP